MRQLMLIIVFMLPAIAQAGPWCLTLNEVMGCSYVSSDACYEAAGKRGGNCMPNPREAGVSGEQAWCVLTDNMRKCPFYFQRQCQSYARRVNGACVPNTDMLIKKAELNELYGSENGINAGLSNACDGDLACEARVSGRDMDMEQ
jgi:hypothetical protein